MAEMASGASVVKKDPFTQNEYTFTDFVDSCSKLFSATAHERFKAIAIKAYWEEECRATGGEGIDEVTIVQTKSKQVEGLGAEAEKNQENSNALFVVMCSKSRVARPALARSKTAPANLSKHEWLHDVMSGGGSSPGVGRHEEVEEAICDPTSLPHSPIRVPSCRNLLSNTSRIHNGDLLFVHVPLDKSNPFEQNIQLNGEATVDWVIERGIEVKVRQVVTHVAMVVAGSRSVVEAVPRYGVRIQTLVDFFSSYDHIVGTSFFHGEIQGVSDEQAEQAVQFALEKVGAGYSHDFLPWADAGKFYCSSLMDHAYQHALGEDHVFFHDTYDFQFQPREYWEGYYRELGKPMPSGAGTNPTLLLHSPRVHYSELIIASRQKESLFFCLDEDDGFLGWC